MTLHKTATRDEWLQQRKQLLRAEKEFLAKRDALSAQRRQLPWVRVDKAYRFETEEGSKSLPDLFGSKSQLIIQHFMYGDDWEAGCPSCSFWADGFDGTTTHMAQRDASFVAVSNAALDKMQAYKKRMNWDFEWVSCLGSDFNHDYQASFTVEQMAAETRYYNYRDIAFPVSEAHGISIFAKDEAGQVYHTYSTYGRGLDNMNVAYQYLDLLPKGRDEAGLPYPMAWLKRHDEY
ncbi:MAG: DUF899 domain-containing protein [Rhizobiaceae bacterium]